MSTSSRLTEVFNSAPEITFDDESKFIFFSDCHRGDNSWADDFAPNQTLMFYALDYYLKAGFTYVEVGDGEELWETVHFEDIQRAHSHIYWKISQFHQDGRFYKIFGNHDIVWKDPQKVQREFWPYYNEITRAEEPFFTSLEIHEGLVFKHQETGQRIFVVHGHQGDLLSDTLWWVGRLLIRVLWKPLQLLGIRDPTSPAKNFEKRKSVELEISRWVMENNQPLICGHTHRPVFPDAGEPPYFNDGSCVHPRCITGMEIENGEISLIKWWITPNDAGQLCVTRTLLEGPRKIAEV
ncbi:MAG: metallophosphoesterase family protein [Chloroflexota bacterium]|nr:metallophosphoesterase family protein [Chloroflexota bacterium]